MAIPTSITDLNTSEAMNSPAGSDNVGGTLDNFLRIHAAIIKRQFSKGADINSASTTVIPPDCSFANVVKVASTINGFSDNFNGRIVYLKFEAGITLAHSSALVMPYAQNVVTEADDVACFVNESAGVWRCVGYPRYLRSIQNSLLRIVTFTSSGTWAPGDGTTSAEIELWGGGGGGTTAADGGDGGISTFVASGFTTLSAGGGQGTRVSESSSQGASGGDINITPPRGSYWQEVDTTTFMIPGRDAPRGGSGGAGVTSRPGSRPGGGGATIILGPAARYGAGAGAYVYKFLATLPASAAITIGAGGSGDYPGGPGMCIIKEYGSL